MTGSRTARSAHFDPTSGASGDMILGALVDAGAPVEEVHRLLSTLPLPAFRIEANEVRVQGFRAIRLTVEVPHEHVHRHLADVERILDAGALPERVRERARTVFRRLAEAEGRVHGIAVERVHFHEVGALDSIVDIVGSAAALEILGVDEVSFSRLHDGTGTVRTAHGEVPVPVPAVVELTRDLPLVRVDVHGELLTPTGAAFLTGLGRFDPTPSLRGERVGVSTGTKEVPGRPNLLRVTLGTRDAAPTAWWESDEVEVVETNVDDMTPEMIAHVLERSKSWGAVDAFVTPCLMKKGRPGHQLTFLAPPEASDRLVEAILRETSTFGLRRRRERRAILRRREREVATPWGPVRVKVGELSEGRVRAAVEFESCREIALRQGRPIAEVFRDVEARIRTFDFVDRAAPPGSP